MKSNGLTLRQNRIPARGRDRKLLPSAVSSLEQILLGGVEGEGELRVEHLRGDCMVLFVVAPEEGNLL